MAKALGDILSNKWDEPPEIQAVKDYVNKCFQANVAVSVKDKSIIIIAPGAALAATLRMHIYDMQQSVGTNKRLVIRIG